MDYYFDYHLLLLSSRARCNCFGETFLEAYYTFISVQEPKEFNRFLFHLYDKWKTSDLLEFFKILPSKNVTLITKTEAADRLVDQTAVFFCSFFGKIYF